MQWLNPARYTVRLWPQTVVPDGTIGLVNARAGAVRPPGRLLGRYVEDTDYFQDGDAFLLKGGEQGRQVGYLPGGARYNINPELFDVVTVYAGRDTRDYHGVTGGMLRAVEIPVGNTGVVITRDGLPPSTGVDEAGRVVPGHAHFQQPWVFLANGGQRGVQQETLDAGSYMINPWFAQVVQIPTRELTLEWTNRSTEKPDNFDTALERVHVNLQGHRLSLEMAQTLTIPQTAAPRLVRRFGQGTFVGTGRPGREPVQRFVGRVLGATVSGYLNEITGKYGVMDFIINIGVVRAQLQDKVINALDGWGVIAGETILEHDIPEGSELDHLRRTLAGQDVELMREIRHREYLTAARDNRVIQADIERIEIKVHGEREVDVLRRQIKLMGPYQVAVERTVERMSSIQVPQFIGGGGDTAERLLAMMPLGEAQEMLKTLIQRYAEEPGRLEPPPDPPAQIRNPAGEHGGG